MIVAVCSCAALSLAFVACLLRAQLRLVSVARACHEIRGPLFALQLGLHGLAGDPARMAAIELELARAGRALEDLAAAPRGRRVASRSELVDLDALLASYAPAWRTLAAGYGATLQVARPAAAERRGSLTVLPEPGAVAVVPRSSAAAATVVADPRRSAAPSAATVVADPRARDALPATTVVADPLRIAQACANLIGNAAEHGDGEVRVRVRAAAGAVRIEVTDDGPGLPASVAAMTAPARTRRGRRGHGLAIASAIAADHGGRLFAAPCETGARLVFELPAAARPPVAA